MLVNSSSSSNASFPPPTISPSINIYHFLVYCLNSTIGIYSITIFTVTNILFLLPLYILILYLGLQRWRQQRSGSTMSHSDVFTYHMVFIGLISVLGSCLCCWGVYTDHSEMMLVGVYFLSINIFGGMFFQILTCVERYLAVVHPVAYRSLKEARGIRMRNVIIGCAWLLCFAGIGLMSLADEFWGNIMSYVLKVFFFTVIAFCSLSVLCVLRRPGPGEVGGGNQRADRSKLRAFYTIMIILGVLLFRFVGDVLSTALYDLEHIGEEGICSGAMVVVWFCLPSSLVLPLLFLQRAGKLLCCKSNT